MGKQQSARIGAHVLHSKYDSAALTAKARAAAARSLNDRLLADIDPHGTLPPHERERRLAHARRAHFMRLAQKSAATRRARGKCND